MKKQILILLALLTISCASRKVAIDKTDTEVKTDSLVITKSEGIFTQNNNIISIETTDEITFTAVDTSSPIEIEGKLFKNAIIKVKKNKKTTVDKTVVKEDVKAIRTTAVKKAINKETFIKKVDKKANYWSYLLLLIPILFLWAIKKYWRAMWFI